MFAICWASVMTETNCHWPLDSENNFCFSKKNQNFGFYGLGKAASENPRCFLGVFLLHFLLYYCSVLWLWLQIKVLLLPNISNKKTQGNICSNLAYFVHIWNISNIAGHKMSLKSNLLFCWSSCHSINYENLRAGEAILFYKNLQYIFTLFLLCSYSIKGTPPYKIVQIPCITKWFSLWLATYKILMQHLTFIALLKCYQDCFYPEVCSCFRLVFSRSCCNICLAVFLVC